MRHNTVLASFSVHGGERHGIGDDPAKALRLGYGLDAELILYGRTLQPGESLAIYVNGQGPAAVSGDVGSQTENDSALDVASQSDRSFIHDPNWWRRGQLRAPVSASWWQLGTNEIRIVYTGKQAEPVEELSITWIDLFLRYRQPK